jgi:hypothetical protein
MDALEQLNVSLKTLAGAVFLIEKESGRGKETAELDNDENH